jgi:hypothetical protein
LEIAVDEIKEEGSQGKTDWSLTSKVARLGSRSVDEPKSPSLQSGATELVPLVTPDTLQNLAVVPLTTPEQLGMLGKWKANNLGRKAAMESIQRHYSSQLDVLAHNLAKAAQVKKARADVLAEEYLKELDTQHLAVLSEFGLRNKETRERALIELTETTVAKLREVQGKDWPEELVHDTISQLLGLRKRVVAEMMKELGEE